MLRALTRQPSPAIGSCQLTHIERVPIDAGRVARQHRAYEAALVEAGCALVALPPLPECPDGVFVEDCAVVAAGRAVLTRPGAPSRRPEVESVGQALGQLLPVEHLRAPATLDGGDVLRLSDTLYVGRSRRTNAEGIRQLRALLAPAGLVLRAVEMRAALHLKSAVTAIDEETVILNPAWVDRREFAGWRILEVAADEPFAANTLRVGDVLILPATHPRALQACAAWVPRIVALEVDEIAKAEGGVSCCSILVETES